MQHKSKTITTIWNPRSTGLNHNLTMAVKVDNVFKEIIKFTNNKLYYLLTNCKNKLSL